MNSKKNTDILIGIIGAVNVLLVSVAVLVRVTSGVAHDNPDAAAELAVKTCPLLPTDKTESVSFAEAESKSPLAAKSVTFSADAMSIASI